jgi:hypothetical protein
MSSPHGRSGRCDKILVRPEGTGMLRCPVCRGAVMDVLRKSVAELGKSITIVSCSSCDGAPSIERGVVVLVTG